MPANRIEFTVPPEMFDRMEAARGDVPRATWIKRAVESALGAQNRDVALERPAQSGRADPASTRPSVDPLRPLERPEPRPSAKKGPPSVAETWRR